MSAPDPVGLGRIATYTFTINNSAVVNNNMAFTDNLPAGVVWRGNVSMSGLRRPVRRHAPTLAGAALVAGTSTSFRVSNIRHGGECHLRHSDQRLERGRGRVREQRRALPAAGFAGALVAASVAAVNDTLNVAGPTLTKTIGPSPAVVNTATTLTFTITNGAGNPAQGRLRFTETLPARRRGGDRAQRHAVRRHRDRRGGQQYHHASPAAASRPARRRALSWST